MLGNEILVFLHIPKTAGTTLHNIIKRQFDDKVHFCAYGNGFKQLNCLKKMSQKEINNIDIVRGHVNYGVHKFFIKNCNYITFLRDPFERIVSHYAYVISNKFHPLHNCFLRSNFSLRDFIKKTTDNDNGQVRALCGLSNTLSLINGKKIPFGFINENHLDQAIKNLESFSFFGIQEYFDQSLLLMKRRLKLEDFPFYIPENIGKKSICPLISDADKDYIREINSYDQRLYDYACKSFKNLIANEYGLVDFELPLFRKANELFVDNAIIKKEHNKAILEANEYHHFLQNKIDNLIYENNLIKNDFDLVSVIMPTYNRSHLIGDSIRSVLQQTYSDIEIIVIDDGSDDNTREVIDKFSDPRIHYVYQTNAGRSNARNNALSIARGRYITFLDSDDLFLPDKIERQVAYLRENPGVGMVYTSAFCINEFGELLEHKYFAKESGFIYSLIAFFIPVTITLPTVMTYREIINQAGLFDENMHRFEDTDMWRRISKICRIDAMPEFTCLLRTHTGNDLVNQNPDDIISAIDYYAEKIINDDCDVDLELRINGLISLYKYYGDALISLPQFDKFGKKLLRRAKFFSKRNRRGFVFSDNYYYRYLKFIFVENTKKILYLSVELRKYLCYWFPWCCRYFYYRSLNLLYAYFSKARLILRKFFIK